MFQEMDTKLEERRRCAKRFNRQMEYVYSRKISSGLFAFTENWILAMCQNTELIVGKRANKSLVVVVGSCVCSRYDTSIKCSLVVQNLH